MNEFVDIRSYSVSVYRYQRNNLKLFAPISVIARFLSPFRLPSRDKAKSFFFKKGWLIECN